MLVHITDSNLGGELFAGTAIVNGGLAIIGQVDLAEINDCLLYTSRCV